MKFILAILKLGAEGIPEELLKRARGVMKVAMPPSAVKFTQTLKASTVRPQP